MSFVLLTKGNNGRPNYAKSRKSDVIDAEVSFIGFMKRVLG